MARWCRHFTQVFALPVLLTVSVALRPGGGIALADPDPETATGIVQRVAEAEARLQTGRFAIDLTDSEAMRSSATLWFDLGTVQSGPRLRMVTTYESADGPQTVESRAIGRQLWQREADGDWQTAPPTTTVWEQLQPFLPHVEASVEPALLDDPAGAVLAWYDPGRETDVRVAVDPGTGIPQHLERIWRATGLKLTVRYEGWNAPVAISPPAAPSAGAEEPRAPGALPEAAPQLSVLAPTNGAMIPGRDVTVQFQYAGLTLVPSPVPLEEAGKRPQFNRPGEGHVHFVLDLQPLVVWEQAAPYTFTNVPAGQHQLMVELVENDHSSFAPPVVQMIRFQTTLAAAAGGPPPPAGVLAEGTPPAAVPIGLTDSPPSETLPRGGEGPLVPAGLGLLGLGLLVLGVSARLAVHHRRSLTRLGRPRR